MRRRKVGPGYRQGEAYRLDSTTSPGAGIILCTCPDCTERRPARPALPRRLSPEQVRQISIRARMVRAAKRRDMRPFTTREDF